MTRRKAAIVDDIAEGPPYVEIVGGQEARYGKLTPKRLSELMFAYGFRSAFALEKASGVGRNAICEHLRGRSILSALNRRRLALVFKHNKIELI